MEMDCQMGEGPVRTCERGPYVYHFDCTSRPGRRRWRESECDREPSRCFSGGCRDVETGTGGHCDATQCPFFCRVLNIYLSPFRPFHCTAFFKGPSVPRLNPCVICLEPIEEGADLTSLLGCEDRHHFHVSARMGGGGDVKAM